MLTLITGVPGAGKTLFAVQQLLKDVEHNDKMRKKLEEGKELNPEKGEIIYNLYADIKGLKIDEVQEAPDDWRLCESPAKWYKDEAQYTFPAKNTRGLEDNPIISEIATHRHLAIDLILITQHPQLISSHIRKFVGRHFHLDRRYGTNIVNRYVADELMTVGGSMKRYDSEPWTHPKKLFDYYESASLHIKNTRLPKALKYLAVTIVVAISLAAFGGYYVFRTYMKQQDDFKEQFSSESQKSKQETKVVDVDDSSSTINSSNEEFIQIVQSPTQEQIEVQPSVNVYLGCITSETRCRCWKLDGTPAYLDFNACKQADKDLPTHFYLQSNS